MAISADSQPHFTTLADFVSSSAEEIAKLFLQVLMVCDAEGLNSILDTQDDKLGSGGKVVQSNITDPGSAKMKTSHGVVQGYTRVAAVDAKHQVIVHAEAHRGFRSRDPRFKDYTRHKPAERLKPKERFTVEDFTYDQKKRTCRCPAGHAMWLQGKDLRIGHHLEFDLKRQFKGYRMEKVIDQRKHPVAGIYPVVELARLMSFRLINGVFLQAR